MREKGVVIQSIICDGKSGLLDSFPDIPVQMCQFHQIKIIMRHLTRKPKSPAAQGLRALLLTLTKITQAEFEAALKRWYEQYAAFLNERSVNEKTGHSHYTHKRLRTAYNSLKRHLPWLFTCERFPELCIPNTTNLLEGKFSEMKQLLWCYRGLKISHSTAAADISANNDVNVTIIHSTINTNIAAHHSTNRTTDSHTRTRR